MASYWSGAFYAQLLVALVCIQLARGQPAHVAIQPAPPGLIPLDPIGIYGSLQVGLCKIPFSDGLLAYDLYSIAVKRSWKERKRFVSCLHAESSGLHAASSPGCIPDAELCGHPAELPASCLPRCSREGCRKRCWRVGPKNCCSFDMKHRPCAPVLGNLA